MFYTLFLPTDPEKRYTIEQVIGNPWIAQYMQVPQTPLHTVRILKEDAEAVADAQVSKIHYYWAELIYSHTPL